MKHWEYKILKGSNWNREESRDGLLAELNTQGGNGWELTAVMGEWFYFKREMKPAAFIPLETEYKSCPNCGILQNEHSPTCPYRNRI